MQNTRVIKCHTSLAVTEATEGATVRVSESSDSINILPQNQAFTVVTTAGRYTLVNSRNIHYLVSLFKT